MLHAPLRSALLAALVALAAWPAAAATPVGDDVPAWLKQAAGAQAPAYDKKVRAVVLLKDRSVVVGEDGRVVTTTNYAVRVLSREGRAEAHAAATYLTNSGKVRELRAWLLRTGGEVNRYGKEETRDAALEENDIYNEYRMRCIHGDADIDAPGAVFGYTSVVEERTDFTQELNSFQGDLPALVSRFTLTLPAGWRASAVTFNHPKVEPTVAGTTYTWEVRNLPPIEDEPSSPSMSALAPRLAVSYYPAPGSQFAGHTFETWADVARFNAGMADPQATLDDAIAMKARELTAGAKTELEKIQAVGRYAQNVKYISIQTNISRGGGYRPHPAHEVFAKSYGDCKDKATLMRAMLKALKVDAFLVSIYSGDPSFVRPEWPSPYQFNHAIIAVKVSDETQAATVVRHPKLGRLLIFDPTDDNTPVGDLPHHEQDSLALINSAESSELLRMPVTRPEDNLWKREVEASLSDDGSITASVRDRLAGQSAVTLRRVFKGLAKPDFTRVVERWVSSAATGAKFTKIETTDDHAAGRFALDVDFAAGRWAQTMQGRLLVFKPAVVGREDSLWLAEPTRKLPLVIPAGAFTETVRFKLPAGFAVDEIPDAVRIDSDFGTYAATYELKDGQLVFTRTLVHRAATIPADKYADVRAFFGRVRASEEAPVVLARK
ncbi:MAG TPA: DUF3857 domain-containing protein [Pyrinomonadaceae bacterium]|jgi:transglutaminase-like putative cysteine protease|nr:DUF3857 domain-containing protein [Pyrinomonadaceae bacterium]